MVNIDVTVLGRAFVSFNALPFSAGFNIKSVVSNAQHLPSHSWEFGTSAEALLELYNPELSVFGDAPFPVPTVNISQIKGLSYAAGKIVFGTGSSALAAGDGSAGDPSSLGVSAVLIGKTNQQFATAAQQTMNALLNNVPRYWNGAISHRTDVPELWADFMYMVPPFLAYYAADTQNLQLLQQAVTQCKLYRQILQSPTTGQSKGAWMHIQGPSIQDTGIWSTGNGWAAAGMTRVLATVTKATFVPDESWRQLAISQLTGYIKEIVDGAMHSPMDGRLLRNYLDDVNGGGNGFGEISGSSLLASAVYRMAVLQPSVFGSTYVAWADKIRTTISGNDANGNPHVTSDGIATPAVNPMNWLDTTPDTNGSPEGQAFVVLLYAGWRDCIRAGMCSSTTAPPGSAAALSADAVTLSSFSKRGFIHNSLLWRASSLFGKRKH